MRFCEASRSTTETQASSSSSPTSPGLRRPPEFAEFPISDLRLQIADDRAEHARREQARPQGTGSILSDRWQLVQSSLLGVGHLPKLPADLFARRVWPLWGGETSRLGGIGGGPQGVRAHVSDACRLSCRPRGGHGRRSADVTGCATADKAAADLFGDVKLAPGKSACPGNRITRTAVPGS